MANLKFGAFEKACIKNTAKEVYRLQGLLSTIDKNIAKLEGERADLCDVIQKYEDNITKLTGYKPLELCARDGNVWKFIYPKTVVPPTVSTDNPDTPEVLGEVAPVADTTLVATDLHDQEDSVPYGGNYISEDETLEIDNNDVNGESEEEEEDKEDFAPTPFGFDEEFN